MELDGRARWSSSPRSVTVKPPDAPFASVSEAGSAVATTHWNPAALSIVREKPVPASVLASATVPMRASTSGGSAMKSSSESRPCEPPAPVIVIALNASSGVSSAPSDCGAIDAVILTRRVAVGLRSMTLPVAAITVATRVSITKSRSSASGPRNSN